MQERTRKLGRGLLTFLFAVALLGPAAQGGHRIAALVLAATLGALQIAILRAVTWGDETMCEAEEALVVVGVTSLFDASRKLSLCLLGLLLGTERKTLVSLSAAVLDAKGNAEFPSSVSAEGRLFPSRPMAVPAEAARKPAGATLCQTVVTL